MYSYHGQCDLVMARSPSFGEGLGLDLHIRTEMINEGAWSFISNAALRIGEDVLEIAAKDSSILVNGKSVDLSLPMAFAGQYSIVRMEQDNDGSKRVIVVVKLDDDEKILFSTFKNMLNVRIEAYLADTEGLLGVHDKPGMVGRDHDVVLTDPNEMGAQWQVKDSDSILFSEVRGPQYPEMCILPSQAVTNRRRLQQHSKEHRQLTAKACADVPAGMYDFCFEDVLVTGHYDLANEYGFAY